MRLIKSAKTARYAGAGIISLLLVPAAVFAYGMDDWAGASASPWFWVIFLTIGGAIGATAVAASRTKWFLAPMVLYGLFLMSLAIVDFSPTKPAVRALAEISPGMSEAQVLAILEKHFPRNGRFKQPAFGAANKGSISFVLDPTDGRYNAAVVTIEFENGVCVRREFSPD